MLVNASMSFSLELNSSCNTNNNQHRLKLIIEPPSPLLPYLLAFPHAVLKSFQTNKQTKWFGCPGGWLVRQSVDSMAAKAVSNSTYKSLTAQQRKCLASVEYMCARKYNRWKLPLYHCRVCAKHLTPLVRCLIHSPIPWPMCMTKLQLKL